MFGNVSPVCELRMRVARRARSEATQRKLLCYRKFELLKKVSELFDGETRVPGDTAHREGVDGVVSGHRQNPGAISHDDVLTLPNDTESCLFESSNRVEVIDTRNLWHSRLYRQLDLTYLCVAD
jgi:hypothetical protein